MPSWRYGLLVHHLQLMTAARHSHIHAHSLPRSIKSKPSALISLQHSNCFPLQNPAPVVLEFPPFELLGSFSFVAMASSSIPSMILSAYFLPNSYRFVLVGSPFIPELQVLAKTFPNPALPLLAPAPITLKKMNLSTDERQGEMIETVYLRPGTDALCLPRLDTSDIDKFVECPGNQVLRHVALLVSDIESLSMSTPSLTPAAQIIFGLKQLETVYAVECGYIGEKLKTILVFREKKPGLQWDMVEVPKVLDGPLGDAMDLFGGWQYPDNPWVMKRAMLVTSKWEEKRAGRISPKLECRTLELRRPRAPPPVG